MLQQKNISRGLRPLWVVGNKIVEAASGRPVRLRGVNRSGLEYAFRDAPCCPASAGLNAFEMDAIASWGANVMRLPFNQAWVLASANMEPQRYLEVLDSVISLAAERGIYTLLDLQWLDADTARGTLSTGQRNFVPALPDAGSIDAWKVLARRYRDESAVLYDVFNEPHDPLADDPTEWFVPDSAESEFRPLRRRRVRAAEWHPWAAVLAAAIREMHSGALVFISGLDWGYDLQSFPHEHLESVVYSSHVYPSKEKKWEKAFGKLSRSHPVFIGEWGGTADDLAWGEKLVRYLDELGVGWAAWSWCDHPHLIRAGTRFEPTAFGELVRHSLA